MSELIDLRKIIESGFDISMSQNVFEHFETVSYGQVSLPDSQSIAKNSLDTRDVNFNPTEVADSGSATADKRHRVDHGHEQFLAKNLIRDSARAQIDFRRASVDSPPHIVATLGYKDSSVVSYSL